MTAKRIPVRVRSTRATRPDPVKEATHDERPEVVPAAQPDEAAVPCLEAVVPEAAPGADALLSDVLSIADNLERALALAQEDTPIRQGVALTHRSVLQLLRKHGLERIEAHRQAFDPNWHEAIDVVSAETLGVTPGTVVQVMAPGYRRGERLFRPARVVVAQ
jgi:hypothetical protein